MILLYGKIPKNPFFTVLVRGNCFFFSKIIWALKQSNTWISISLVWNRHFLKFSTKNGSFERKVIEISTFINSVEGKLLVFCKNNRCFWIISSKIPNITVSFRHFWGKNSSITKNSHILCTKSVLIMNKICYATEKFGSRM